MAGESERERKEDFVGEKRGEDERMEDGRRARKMAGVFYRHSPLSLQDHLSTGQKP